MTPADILAALVRANLVASATILLVVALRKGLRSVCGARVAYGLWLMPPLASFAVLLPASRVVVARGFAVFRLPTTTPTPPPLGSSLDVDTLLFCLWLVGALCAGLIMARMQARFASAARRGLAGPAVAGVVAPVIVTPGDFELRFSREEQALIMAHERTHIVRQDPRINGLCCAAQCLCWFNPLVHVAARLMRIDQEMACDEAVVTRLPNARRLYAQVLVKAQLATGPLPLGCYWPSRSEHPLLERLAMLKLKVFSPARRWAGACGLAILCAGAGFAAWAAQPADTRVQPTTLSGLPTQAVADGPVNITAKEGKVVDAGQGSVWRGGASATVGGDRLMSDEIDAHGSPATLKLVASGHVLYVSARGTARADEAVYASSPRTLTLTGDVVAMQGKSEYRGEKLVIDLTK